ncbi:hypothetical protein diail_9093, partial [Diaporthe ilicicola]
MFSQIIALALATGALADSLLSFNTAPAIENRTIDEIYQAALKEGGTVTLWAGGDETNQQDSLKKAFEAAFPGMTLNVTVDVSKYHDGKIDQQLASGNVFVDATFLQTLHDFPRWAQQGSLLNYAPAGFDQIYPAFKSEDASWYGLFMIQWGITYNTAKLPGVTIAEYPDFLQAGLKDKLVLTYPNDDDAVLYQFYLIMNQYGESWFDKLLTQNPRWVRGTATPSTILKTANATEAATFTSYGSPYAAGNGSTTAVAFPVEGQFVSWAQVGGILKGAPHPESARLLFNYILSPAYQSSQWSVRRDIPVPDTIPYPDLWHMNGTNPTSFFQFMQDRPNVERLKLYFENRIGTAQGLSPLIDD